jgi:hypothetical protein
MPPDQILSTYPPANAEGSFETRLPQVVLKRRTLPWERVSDAGSRAVPWLALVVIAEGEGQISGETPVKDCVTPGVTLNGPNDVATGFYLSVSETVVSKVFPTHDDLALLTHVREVDLSDTELAMGDDDGFLAIVMANRLPQYDRINCVPVRYMACLINLEGQLDTLPQPLEFTFTFDAMAYVQDDREMVTSRLQLKAVSSGAITESLVYAQAAADGQVYAAADLAVLGCEAHALEGGSEAWRAAGLPLHTTIAPGAKLHRSSGWRPAIFRIS